MAAHGLASLKQASLFGRGGDVINFRVSIPASASISQPSAEKLRIEYDYYLTEIFASMTGAGNTANAGTADTQYDDVDEIRFQLKVSGTGENLFSTDVELQGLVDSNSGRSAKTLNFDPGMRLPAGSDLSIEFKRRATSITTARIVDVYLVCMLVPKDSYKRLAG